MQCVAHFGISIGIGLLLKLLEIVIANKRMRKLNWGDTYNVRNHSYC